MRTGQAASRQPHKLEVLGSTPRSATSIYREKMLREWVLGWVGFGAACGMIGGMVWVLHG